MNENLARKWGDDCGIQGVDGLASTTTDFVGSFERLGQAVLRTRAPDKTDSPESQ